MPIIQCTEQSKQSLEDFYKSLIPDRVTKFVDVGSPMLKVIKLINDTFKNTVIYGLTSHATLKLLNKNSTLATGFVALKGFGTDPGGKDNEYYIEYLMTADKQPWPNACVIGGTKSLTELKRLIIIAMTESKGWPDSNELKDLYESLEK